MKQNIKNNLQTTKQALVNAIVANCGTSKENAKRHIFTEAQQKGAKEALKATNLFLNGHSFELKVSEQANGFCLKPIFHELVNLDVAEEAIHQYWGSEEANKLRLEEMIVDKNERLSFVYHAMGELNDALGQLFLLLDSAPLACLLERILIKDEILLGRRGVGNKAQIAKRRAMEAAIKDAIVEALVNYTQMSQEEAEERVLDADDIDGGFDVDFNEEVCGEGQIQFEVCDLSAAGHSFYITFLFTQRANTAFVHFEGTAKTDVDDALARYDESELSQKLCIELDDDILFFSYDLQGDLKQALSELFALLDKQELTQLLDSILEE